MSVSSRNTLHWLHIDFYDKITAQKIIRKKVTAGYHYLHPLLKESRWDKNPLCTTAVLRYEWTLPNEFTKPKNISTLEIKAKKLNQLFLIN